jgi:hypothetical protein
MGFPQRLFFPSRGIYQVDPLSPFLFVIMAKGLSHYIKASITNGSLQGLPLHEIQFVVSHSQFVDDTMMMGSPTTKEAPNIHSLLNDFSEAS